MHEAETVLRAVTVEAGGQDDVSLTVLVTVIADPETVLIEVIVEAGPQDVVSLTVVVTVVPEPAIEVVAVHCVIGTTGVHDPEAVVVMVDGIVTVLTPPEAVVVTVPPGRVTVLTPPDTVLVTVDAGPQDCVFSTVLVTVVRDPPIEVVVVAVHCVIGTTGVQDPEAVLVMVETEPGRVTVP